MDERHGIMTILGMPVARYDHALIAQNDERRSSETGLMFQCSSSNSHCMYCGGPCWSTLVFVRRGSGWRVSFHSPAADAQLSGLSAALSFNCATEHSVRSTSFRTRPKYFA